MASASGTTNPPKKRNTFFNYILSSKNLSIFRHKTSTPTDNTKNPAKESQHYKSQTNVNTQVTPVPMCIGRSWLKKQQKRPVSLDLDLVNNFIQEPTIKNNEQLLEERQQPLNDIGTLMDRLSVLYIYLFIGNSKEKKITDTTEILVVKQIVDMPVKQTGKYFLNITYPWECLYSEIVFKNSVRLLIFSSFKIIKSKA